MKLHCKKNNAVKYQNRLVDMFGKFEIMKPVFFGICLCLQML